MTRTSRVPFHPKPHTLNLKHNDRGLVQRGGSGRRPRKPWRGLRDARDLGVDDA